MPSSSALRKQLGRRGERVGHRILADRHGRRVGAGRLAHDEAAADRVVGPLEELGAGRVRGREAHPVRVLGQRLAAVEDQVFGRAQGDRVPAEQAHDLLDADAVDSGGDLRPGRSSRAPRPRGPGAPLGRCRGPCRWRRAIRRARPITRAVRVELLMPLEGQREPSPGAHRADRMRARRPDADREEVEDGNRHIVDRSTRRTPARGRPGLHVPHCPRKATTR